MNNKLPRYNTDGTNYLMVTVEVASFMSFYLKILYTSKLACAVWIMSPGSVPLFIFIKPWSIFNTSHEQAQPIYTTLLDLSVMWVC